MSGHPHIVTVHRSGRTTDDRPFLVMEFCDQGSLGDQIERSGPLPWQRATEIAVKAAGALETAHRAGIVHRDIKPANILLSNLNEPKLADFGIARMEGAPETQSATITASLAHAAPEVLDGERPDARSDVYSLASTLYELLTGSPAFVQPGDASMLPIVTRIARDPVPPLSPAGVPPAVAEVVVRSMAKNPAERPATAAEFGRLLAEAQQQAGAAPTTMMVEGVAPPVPAEWAPSPAEGRTQQVAAPSAAPSDQVAAAALHHAHTSDAVTPATSSGRSGLLGAALFAAVTLGVLLLGAGAFLLFRSGSDDAPLATEVTTAADAESAPEPRADDEGSANEPSEGGDDAEPVVQPATDEPLAIGTLLPVTGNLEFFGGPTSTAVELAVEDINAAGGVLGMPVELVPGDSGDRDETRLRSESARLGDASVDVVVGPFLNGDTQFLLDNPDLTGEMLLISPTATNQNLTDLDTNGTFFRTAPTEVTQGNVVAQIISDAGHDRLAIAHVEDDYGSRLAENISFRYAQLGGVVSATTPYGVDADLGAVAESLVASRPEAIVILGFEETPTILAELQALDVGPGLDGTPVFGVDANAILGDADPAVANGYRGILPRIDLRPLTPFTSRLEERGVTSFAFAPESYDAAVIGALAAESSGATSGPALAEAIVGVTRDGEKCFDFAECKRLLSEGADIDYDGLAGPYEFTDEGDPRVASYVILTYDGDSSANPTLDEYVFSR
jgi:branched-chain amino acid transport system substrate-binding protein